MISIKGQVTMFVIIGLVLLLAVGLVFFLTRVLSVDQPSQPPTDVSLDTRPARTLVESCLQSSLEGGLRLVGSQGGLSSPPQVVYPSYRGESVLYEPFAVPYWRYLDECGEESCELSNQPRLCASDATFCAGFETGSVGGIASIESNLERHILDNIDGCIDGFSSIADRYAIEERGSKSVDVIFADGSTRVVLEYPIVLRSLSTENTQVIEQYEAQADVDMLRMYELADEILTLAKETNYYEYQTLRVMSVYADPEGDLPPMDHIQFVGNAGGPWIQEEVKQRLQDDILSFMSLVRFANTRNGYPITSPDLGEYTQYADGFYTSFVPKTSETLYNDLKVNHQYIYDPIYLKVGDGSQIIEAEPLAEIKNPIIRAITNLALKDYRFDYDISYPLIISIEDEHAMNGEGYSFDFAIEVNIRNNYPGYGNFTVIQSFETADVGLGDFSNPVEHTFLTYDKHTDEPLDDVIITYVCGNEYEVGYTDLAEDTARLQSTMPPCDVGGHIRYQKNGYLGESVPFNNVEGIAPQQFTLELWPIKERSIIIRKRTIQDIEAIQELGTQASLQGDQYYTDVSVNDSIIFSIDRQETSPYDTRVPLIGFFRYERADAISGTASSSYARLIQDALDRGIYTQEEADELLGETQQTGTLDVETQSEHTVGLVPGNYSVEATLLHLPGVQLPEADIDGNTSWFADIFVDDNVHLEAQNFSTWISGGAELSDIHFTEADVYRDNPLIFYVLKVDPPSSWEDLIFSPSLEESLPLYSAYLQPEFI